jgi:tetratricopeptide (TPR) repeat protein
MPSTAPTPARPLFDRRGRNENAYTGSMVLPGVGFVLAAILAAAPATTTNPATTEMAAIFDRAVALQKAGKLADAIPEYQRFLALQPGNVEARSNLGAAFAAQGHYAEAIEQYQQALRVDEGNAQVRLNLAVAYYKAADVTTAAAELVKIVAAAPSDKRAVVLLADCYLRLGENRKVIDLLTPWEDKETSDLAFAYLLGTALIRDDQVSKGQRLIDKIMGRGESAEAHLMLGTAYQMAQEWAPARDEFAKAVALNPKLPGAHAYYGRALLATTATTTAAEQFRKELEINPNDFDANLFLGVLAKQEQKHDEAMARFQKALSVRPGDLGVRYQVGSLLLLDGKLDPARENLEAVVKDAPKFLEAHVSLATLYYRLKRKDDGDRERAIVQELTKERQAQAPGARDDLGPAYRGEALPGPPKGTVNPPRP